MKSFRVGFMRSCKKLYFQILEPRKAPTKKEARRQVRRSASVAGYSHQFLLLFLLVQFANL